MCSMQRCMMAAPLRRTVSRWRYPFQVRHARATATSSIRHTAAPRTWAMCSCPWYRACEWSVSAAVHRAHVPHDRHSTFRNRLRWTRRIKSRPRTVLARETCWADSLAALVVCATKCHALVASFHAFTLLPNCRCSSLITTRSSTRIPDSRDRSSRSTAFHWRQLRCIHSVNDLTHVCRRSNAPSRSADVFITSSDNPRASNLESTRTTIDHTFHARATPRCSIRAAYRPKSDAPRRAASRICANSTHERHPLERAR